MINFRKVKSFNGGLSIDTTENIEKNNTYQKSSGGRLYSKNGVFSFSGGAGTKLIYSNENIVKYLGFYSFEDEIIVFAKCNYALTEITELINFDSNFSTETLNDEIDLNDYYTENENVSNNETCSITDDSTPINNLLYNDCIISFSLDSDYNLVGEVLWVGQQNWPTDGKISCEGVYENQYYKRVYYTDAINNRRVMNRFDSSLSSRTADEFNQILDNTILQPEVTSIQDGGQLKSMKVLYVYRIISANGQVSEFSPTSFFVDVLPETEAIKYTGGDVSEITGKLVNIKCNILNPEDSSEIECFAIEYETLGVATAIRNLGLKSAANVVTFKHYGNESEEDDVTLSDITSSTITWKYCNDFSSKKNKLIAAGLRNEPTSTEINNLEYLFPLHSWDKDGNTHESLINPKPWEYRYIDPSNTESLIYIKNKIYRKISSFGPLTIELINKNTLDSISLELSTLNLESYTDITQSIIDWLIEEKNSNINFESLFPNLDIINSSGQLLFSPIDESIKTDVSDYYFESNNSQYLEDFDNNIVFLNPTINTDNLVYGAKSIGFDSGTGVRLTYREFKEPLLNQATEIYDGSGSILDYITPSGEKYGMKGEIYRIGFATFDNDSTPLFAIPLGDIMIPNLGDLQSSIDDEGNAVITSTKYVNQSVSDGVLYGHGIKMHIEVRLSCSLQELMPMYQIAYVERDEDNSTILCQGIAQPLQRVQDNGNDRHRMSDPIRNKWTLPYYGGPFYEKNGFYNYDTYGENDQYEDDDHERRVMTNRKLMYFDSPDLYFGKVSDQYIESSILDIKARLNTDHTPEVIMEHGGQLNHDGGNTGDESYPKFSRKILEDYILGDTHADDLPDYASEKDYDITNENYFYNVSVFSEYTPFSKSIIIDKAEELLRAEEISGVAFDLDNDVSNNAFGLPTMPWYYSSYARKWSLQDGAADKPNSDIFRSAMTSFGYKTIIIKSSEDLFDDDFTGDVTIPAIDTQVRLGNTVDYGIGWDSTPLINIFRNNRESVYGGRSEQAYSQNTYIPLSKTIPTLKSSNNAQVFDVGLDTYITLNIRTKNDWGDDEIKEYDLHNHGGGLDSGSFETWSRNAVWAYVVVLESQVEPKLAYQYEFYKESSDFNFNISRDEVINPAYLNINSLKSYIPKPYKYEDDPDRGNVIAVSDVKLAGDYYDSWTVFKTNNFYSLLEKNKGDISNLIKQDEELFAIQTRQTSLIYIGSDRIITDSDGSPINLQQGTGTVVDGHKVISSYGTSIRRSIVSNDFGFCFFDENKIEFIKIKEPLLIKNLLHLHYFNLFKKDKIVDTESWYDHEHKETCIRIRTENDNNFTLSYNEKLGVFNGELPYDNDIYMMFDEKIYAPIIENGLSSDLHQLNAGDVLNFFNVDTDLVLGFYINADIDKVFQYKQVGIITNLEYPIEKIFANSNLGYDRTILGTHNWYKIREGIHTVPLINETNELSECTDVRGNWVYIEITAKSLNKNKVDILAVLNDLRYSHQ